MTIRERILTALRSSDRLCDDCLSEVTGIRPRQAVNAEGRRLKSSQVLSRAIEACAGCRRIKLVNILTEDGTRIDTVAKRRLLHSVSSAVRADREPRREHEGAGMAPNHGVGCYLLSSVGQERNASANEALQRRRAGVARVSATVVLLSCVKSKRAQRCRAGDMYTSPLFQKMMAYAHSLNPKRIFILSAKYGLLSPDDLIEPYELTLKRMKTGERRAWAERVLVALRENCDFEADQFVVLAGVPYRENLLPHIKHYVVPMKGLDFGTQLQWLGQQVS